MYTVFEPVEIHYTTIDLTVAVGVEGTFFHEQHSSPQGMEMKSISKGSFRSNEFYPLIDRDGKLRRYCVVNT